MTYQYDSFKELWPALVQRYGNQIAYFKNHQAQTYNELDQNIQYYQKKFLHQDYVHINGVDSDWFTQSLAAWIDNKLVIPFNPEWEKTDKVRFQLAMSPPQNIHWEKKPHLLLFTSGSTGTPKPIIRNTDFALYEANAYIKDILSESFDEAICFIKPWFGAITKHCLGMLIAGIPQHFSFSEEKKSHKKTLIYGTPSLITHHASTTEHAWHAISLTGETINAHHISAFQKCLDPKGFILDSYGSTECGVIARRKIRYQELHNILEIGFVGEILPGKKVVIDNTGALSVLGKYFPLTSIGDFAKSDGKQLQLLGRFSHQRKIRGVWHDVSPLLKLLSSHPDILHAELSPEQTQNQQLIVYLSVKASIEAKEIYSWLYKHLSSVALLPQIIISHEPPSLGVTGKLKFSKHSQKHDDFNHYISFMVNELLNPIPHRSSFLDEPLESQGFDSIDIVSLMIALEKKLGKPFPGRSLLKSDTPRQIKTLLNQDFSQNLLRTLNPLDKKDHHVICLGSGILCAHQEITKIAHLKYTDIIDSQKNPFHFSDLASHIIKKEWQFFSTAKNIYLAGYSIYALLAIEIAYQLEILQIPVQGLFLLDPPNRKRAQYLKRKKYFLSIRSKLLRILPHYHERYCYELRKLAISQQPTRILKCPSLTLFSSTCFSKNPWLEPNDFHQTLKLNFSGHLELVRTTEGINSWVKTMITDIHYRFKTEAVIRETAVMRFWSSNNSICQT